MEKTRPQPTLLGALAAFHHDEDGMEALQVVMIVGVAAVILAVITLMFPGIRTWVVDSVKKITGFKDEGGE